MHAATMRRSHRTLAAVVSLLAVFILGAVPPAGQPADVKPQDAPVEPKPAMEAEKDENKEPVETILWNLTYFLSSRIRSESMTSSRSTRIQELVDALNALYGKKNEPAAVLAGGGSLLLRGTKEQLREMKRFLVQLDSPLPQVQMTLWALQMSGTQDRIACEMERLSSDVRATREAIHSVQRELAQIAQAGGLQGCAQDLQREILCRRSPIFLPSSGPLSLNETLVLLTAHGDRQKKVQSLRSWVQEHFSQQVAALGPDYLPFRRLEKAFDQRDLAGDCQAFKEFLFTLNGYEHGEDGAPEAVVRTGTILDRVLKDVMDAYAVDMSELFLDPLLARAQMGSPGCATKRKGDGVSLTGRSRIVVTSGLTSGLTPTMSSPVEISRPAPFGKELLDRAFPDKKEGNPDLTGADRILANLTQSQALLLAAALSEPETRFAEVAPGIEVKVRPTVLPDGAAARLTIDASFGVKTTPLDPEADPETRNEPPAPAIERHRVETDAAVDVFDLFDVSSFSVTTSHPRAPLSVPVLGRLPVLGRIFQWPRRPKVVHHESIILVNTVVLPRALSLSQFYRLGDFERAPRPEECTGGSGPSGR